jgi:hypothetical protein
VISKSSVPVQKKTRETNFIFIFALSLIIFAGGFVRIRPVILSAFPLNDGGLFHTMTMDLKNNGFSLPQTTTYNSAGIPFAYPPFAFYLTGLLSTLTGWKVLDIIRILPAVISTLTIPAFFLLAREIIGHNVPALLGTLTFAMIPRTFEWLIMGGGITRSFGLLFVTLAIWQGYRFILKSQIKSFILFILFSTLVVYTHPEAAVHLAIGILFFYLVCNRSRKSFIFLLLAAIMVAIFTAPWWAIILQRHSIHPFLAASAAARQDSYNPLVGLIVFFRYYFTDEPFTAIFASIGLIGFFRLLSQRNFLMPVWLFAAHLIEPRGGILYMMLPLSIAAGIGLDEVVLPALNFKVNSIYPIKIASVFLTFLFFYGTFSADFSASQILNETTLNPADLAAFEWVRENTILGSRFVLITGENGLRDPSSEWFPSITFRHSQTTVFGYEWIDDDRFSERKQQYITLQDCAFQEVKCLEKWSRQTGLIFNYVYIRQAHASTMIQVTLDTFLRQSMQYKLVYQSPQVDIFEQLSVEQKHP